MATAAAAAVACTNPPKFNWLSSFTPSRSISTTGTAAPPLFTPSAAPFATAGVVAAGGGGASAEAMGMRLATPPKAPSGIKGTVGVGFARLRVESRDEAAAGGGGVVATLVSITLDY